MDIFEVTDLDHDYFSHTLFSLGTSEYKDEVIAYIAGYVTKKLIKILHCAECVDAVIAKSTEKTYNLINIKSRGFLLSPSKDVLNICKKVENAIRIYLKINKVLNKFNMNYFVCDIMEKIIDENIFINLKNHINDQSFYCNHVNNLVRCIIEIYNKVRLCHVITNVDLSERHKLNKLILFEGQ